MLTIYTFPISVPANRVLMCAEALGLSYENVIIDLGTGEHKKPEFLAINPLGKVPSINDDGFILNESTAIMKYLARKANNTSLYPTDIKQQAKVDQQCDFITSHVNIQMSKIFYNKVIAPKFSLEIDQRSMEEGAKFLQGYFPVIDSQLGQTAFIAGDTLTIADISMLATLEISEMCGVDFSAFPHIVAWCEKMHEHEFYKAVYQMENV